MTKSFQILLAVSVLCGAVFVQPVAEAADVNVTWKNPDKYRDIYSGNESKKRFRKRTFKALEEHFLALAEALPKNQILEIEVTNIDLAGDVHHGSIKGVGGQQLRVVESIYYPRFEFSFKLLASDGTTMLTKKENIKDMGFMSGTSLRYRNKTLGYEKQLLDDWFKDTFENYVMK
jgi:hypothetical protein